MAKKKRKVRKKKGLSPKAKALGRQFLKGVFAAVADEKKKDLKAGGKGTFASSQIRAANKQDKNPDPTLETRLGDLGDELKSALQSTVVGKIAQKVTGKKAEPRRKVEARRQEERIAANEKRKLEAKKKSDKIKKGQQLLDKNQQEGLKKVAEANKQDTENINTQNVDDIAAQYLNAYLPQATGNIGPVERFGEYSSSPTLNAYDALINRFSGKRTGAQQKLANMAPIVTGGAGLAGGIGGALLGGLIGAPQSGGVLGSSLAGLGTQAGLGYLTTPKSTMSKLVPKFISQQGLGTRAQRSIGNLIGGQRSGLQNYFADRLFGPQTFRQKVGRFIGGQPTFTESLRSTLLDPNLASNVRTGLEGSITLYNIARDLGLNRYAKKALSGITNAIGLGGLAQRLGLNTPQATGGETGEELSGDIVSGLAGRYFPDRRREIIQARGSDPGTYGEEEILQGAREELNPLGAAHDIQRAKLQRKEQEEGVLTEGLRKLNAIQRQREEVRSRAQQQKFKEKIGIQNLSEREAQLRAMVNSENRRLDTTGISLGQKIQPVPLRRQGYIPSPTSEYITDASQRLQGFVAPHVFYNEGR